MNFELPVSFHHIVDEIVAFTSLRQSEVEHRVWMEALQTGWNVANDASSFNVRPHVYDDAMINLYRDSFSFIFETMVYWANPGRQKWIRHTLARLCRHGAEHNQSPAQLSVLLLGDGTGNDSLYLALNGFNVTYFDVPHSRTFDFATRRFTHYNDLSPSITVKTDYDRLRSEEYDAVISFEVLEHLPDPCAAIRDISWMLRPGGIAIVTESFALVTKELPTHLESNLRYDGSTAFLFLMSDLVLTWYSREPVFKPMEFTKRIGARNSSCQRLNLVTDKNVLRQYLEAKKRSVVRSLGVAG